MKTVLERESRESEMETFNLASLIGSGIYHHVQNGETRPTVVSEVGVVARTG